MGEPRFLALRLNPPEAQQNPGSRRGPRKLRQDVGGQGKERRKETEGLRGTGGRQETAEEEEEEEEHMEDWVQGRVEVIKRYRVGAGESGGCKEAEAEVSQVNKEAGSNQGRAEGKATEA